jgi:hypothetical protein
MVERESRTSHGVAGMVDEATELRVRSDSVE